ncbi:hypothetical protein LBMAG42_18360 [Deltaproteobacteria bacterium]|nr:hypothetical protein LBMAG42_18360 [Deltaproteobacteria bacterium]
MRLLLLATFPILALGCRVEGGTKYIPDRDEDGINEESDCDDGDANIGVADTYYYDGDRDGHGATDGADSFCDRPEGYAEVGDDCDDANSAVFPGAEDVCDGQDNDCDGVVDNGLESAAYYADLDGDGYGSDSSVIYDCTAPEGMVAVGGDCDDADKAYNPGALEEDCEDPNDYNCDGSVGYDDADGDGFAACTECDDSVAAVNPDAMEVCNGIDDNCNSLVDDDDADLDVSSGTTVYADLDGDGYGDPGSPATMCEPGAGWSTDATDCDDLNPFVNLAATEKCDGIDNDCDGAIDDADGSLDTGTADTWYTDADSDGYGDDATASLACIQPTGSVAIAGDCDDADAAYNPAATEADCTDPNDYNCDGSTGYTDADADGWAACEECDDTSAANFPGATELCDSADNDCDGTVDEADAADALTWYDDADSDGYGDAAGVSLACSAPAGSVADDTDCDDADGDVHPGAVELCNGTDDDCDGTTDESAVDGATWYADADLDGYGDASSTTADCSAPAGYVANDDDCDDTDSAVSPAAMERCDSIDNDCDGDIDEDASIDVLTWYIDADADTYGSTATTAIDCDQPAGYVSSTTDCNDASNTVHPGATEACNSIDDDCDGVVDDGATGTASWYADADSDGYGDTATTTVSCSAPAGYVSNDDDCDDTNARVSPGDAEICNSVDDDCDGSTDEGVTTTYYRDQDGDTYGVATMTTEDCTRPAGYAINDDDCNDYDSSAYPGSTEVHDSVDNDCDGSVDEGWWVGTGADGALSLSAGTTTTVASGLPVTAISTDNFTVDGTPTVAAGDEVLVINMHGGDTTYVHVGVYEFYTVDSVSGSVVTMTDNPSVTFGQSSNSDLTGQSIQMVRVPQYTDVTLAASAILTADAWDGETGGVIAFRATGTVSLASGAAIVADELGYWGGETGTIYNNDGFQGESYAGEGDGNLGSGTGVYGNWAAGYYLNNYGGGGAMITGGGGEYAGGATAGDSWTGGSYPEAYAGDTYGDTDLTTMFAGSGGAGVWYGASSPGSGGNGAGLIFMGVQDLTVTSASSISAIGGTTAAWATGTWTYGAGGGAGGTVWIMADTMTVPAGGIAATGGFGESTHTRDGGDGGEGRIRVDTNEINGYMITASAATTAANSACDPNPGYFDAP